MNTQKINATLNDIKSKTKRLWDENPVIPVVLAIGIANAGAKVIKASAENRNSKAWKREVKRRETNDRKSK